MLLYVFRPKADFESVCYSCDPELIQLFLDRGADPISGYPIYRGFQNCLNPIIAVYKANIERVPALQVQADLALCYFGKTIASSLLENCSDCIEKNALKSDQSAFENMAAILNPVKTSIF
ncbi:MAG: hypothetical protein JOZ31_11325 [Verrucomicrobia bacterium]|nr:hypothetical protein [Verrucomicrobiota bacterium]MBV8483439.1 hypothetical protein [Verrucomicrobiota bacterium]